MRTPIQKRSFFTLLFVVVFLVSCDSKRIFDQYQSVNSNGWKTENILRFNFSVKDTLAQRNLYINIRNNNNYPFSNLFLITKMKFPNREEIIDTLEYDMADASGKFLGTGFSEIKENKLFYKENITFPITGKYVVEISQAMRKSDEINGVVTLEGITDVGFRIEKID